MVDEGRRALLVAGVAGAAGTWLGPAASRGTAGEASVGQDAAQARAGTDAVKRTVELPGLVDLQVNGFAGVDFNDPALGDEQVARAVEAIGRTGVTRFLPTLVTSSSEGFTACARRLARATQPAIAGVHMEGPYISPEDGYRGAHPRAFVRPADVEDFRRRQDAAGGRIRIVTLAPESPGALSLIEHLVRTGVHVALGHTGASGAQILDAVNAGATLSTHLGNGCAALLPRHPNVIWEQLGEDRLLASFIVDGHHLPPATVRAMFRAKTPARTILVTDAIAAAGMPPGRYVLGGETVELEPSGRVSVPGTPYLAGSALRLDAAIGNAVRFTGLPLEEVVAMASSRPAAYLGIEPAGKITAEWDPRSAKLTLLRVVA
ncbi:MAG TPA: amidohydrolase family protein [Vicinamibacteria bacterium]|nr:amidohydrolase family protein [Vicinamibacteria bacterium]